MDSNSNSVPPNQLPNFMSMPYQVPQYHQQDTERQALQQFWQQQFFDIQNAEGFKSQQQLPVARIKRIMKADGDVKMTSAEAPMVFAKACEIFFQDLTLRAWMRTEENKTRTLQHCDIAKAIKQDDVFDFLLDAVHCDHAHGNKEENAGKSAEANLAILPYPAAVMENPMANMGSMSMNGTGLNWGDGATVYAFTSTSLQCSSQVNGRREQLQRVNQVRVSWKFIYGATMLPSSVFQFSSLGDFGTRI